MKILIKVLKGDECEVEVRCDYSVKCDVIKERSFCCFENDKKILEKHV